VLYKYCEHHNFTNPPEIKRPLADDISVCVTDQWDVEFINSFNFDNTVDLLLIADKMKCKGLMDLCYTKLALTMRSI
jgi:hypothetical protein